MIFTGPTIHLKHVGRTHDEDIYEAQLTGGLGPCAGGGHPQPAIEEFPTGAGVVYICAACSSVWLVPRGVPKP